MVVTGAQFENIYRLMLGSDRHGEPHLIEFAAAGVESALAAAARHGMGRTAQLFENGRALLNIHAAEDGFWVITPTGAHDRVQPQA